MPYDILHDWLDEEKMAGAPKPNQAILSTVDGDTPHSRVIAISDITESGFVFFTQANTRKVHEIAQNPKVSLNYWLELNQKQIIIEGSAKPLTDAENISYWQDYPKEAQARFAAYAPTSSQVIDDKDTLERKKTAILDKYKDNPIPYDELYVGHMIKPARFAFYHYRTDVLSDVFQFTHKEGAWVKELLSP